MTCEREDIVFNLAFHDLVNDLVADLALRSEGVLTRRECLFGLRVERRVLNKAVDEDEEVVLNVQRLEVYFVFLGHLLEHFRCYLVSDVRHVRATSSSVDAVHEGYVLLLPLRCGDTHFPAVIYTLMDLRAVGLVLEKEVNVVGKALDWDLIVVEVHLRVLSNGASDVVHAFAHQLHNAILKMVHLEALQVGREGDFCPIIAGAAGFDGRFGFALHVAVEHLLVLLLA